jgi:hydrogenase maturation protease
VKPVLVLGYGNPLRRDDAFGRSVVESLIGRWPQERVRLESSHQLLIEYCRLAAESRYVVFVDARLGSSPGRVTSLEVVPKTSAAPSPLAHHLTPELLLRACEEFYGCRPQARLVSVEAADLGHGEGFSQAVEAALPKALGLIETLIEERLEVIPHA